MLIFLAECISMIYIVIIQINVLLKDILNNFYVIELLKYNNISII